MTSFWAGKRVLVTGGAGFLGSHVVDQLRQAGCPDPIVFRSRDYDLAKENHVARLFRDHPADIVVHLAGLVGGIGANKERPADFFYQNLMMGALTLHYAWKTGVRKFVCAGAGCGYPEHAPIPLREENFWDGFPQQESAPYSLAKRMLHVQSLAYWRQHRFPAIVTIPGNIYGPYDNFDLRNAHVIPALVRKFVEAADDPARQTVEVWGTGRPTRDFVYAGDVAEGILRAGEVYDSSALVNLSSGAETSIRQVVDALVEITGFRGRIAWNASQPDGQLRRLFDVSKAERELGFRARTSLVEGLRLTVDWYRIHRAEARNDAAIPS
ncbi:MAG TPA: NAD-dependent epimerase/dehydratase family protein [Candidatus Acidoferrales bacterium]|nr:NAD-dependent epimerase/dehydratase family protein [Candidatus Acidoferrales bacterium]